jgi:hypothetical protein
LAAIPAKAGETNIVAAVAAKVVFRKFLLSVFFMMTKFKSFLIFTRI